MLCTQVKFCNWIYDPRSSFKSTVTVDGQYTLSRCKGQTGELGSSLGERAEIKQQALRWRNFCHDDVIKRKLFPRNWPFVPGIHPSPVNSPHKGQWHGALILWSAPWIHGCVNNREAGDLRRHRAHYDVIVMRMGIQHPGCTFIKQCSWNAN